MAQTKKDMHQVAELTADLQRVRADFENYRKRVEIEKVQATQRGEMKAIAKLLPVIDTIDRAIMNVPEHLSNEQWVQGIAGLDRQLRKQLEDLGVTKINADKDTVFDPNIHQAVQMDEADGDTEVIAEELQSGYMLGDTILRPAMVRVTRA